MWNKAVAQVATAQLAHPECRAPHAMPLMQRLQRERRLAQQLGARGAHAARLAWGSEQEAASIYQLLQHLHIQHSSKENDNSNNDKAAAAPMVQEVGLCMWDGRSPLPQLGKTASDQKYSTKATKTATAATRLQSSCADVEGVPFVLPPLGASPDALLLPTGPEGHVEALEVKNVCPFHDGPGGRRSGSVSL